MSFHDPHPVVSAGGRLFVLEAIVAAGDAGDAELLDVRGSFERVS